MTAYDSYIATLKEMATKTDEQRFAAKQLLLLHRLAADEAVELILELGVDKGQSTRVFLNALEGKTESKSRGDLVSIDIRDCASAVSSDQWTFLCQDSTAIAQAIEAAPILKNGIDLIYVDSLHLPAHVEREIYGFWPYLKTGGKMIFDDIESLPYMRGARKDNVGTEIANRNILRLLEAIFCSNFDKLDMSIHKGSTGLAVFEKIDAAGSRLAPPKYKTGRRVKLFWQVLYRLVGKRFYRHKQHSADSLFIDATKYDR